MKKYLLIVLVLLMVFFSLFGCNNSKKTSATTSGGSDSVESVNTDEQILTEKYYDYFNKLKNFAVFFNKNEDEVLVEINLSNFAVCNMPNVIYPEGNTKDEYNAFTKKYFGKEISTFNNGVTLVLETGKVITTGWTYKNTTKLVLKSIDKKLNGSKTAEFYVFTINDELFDKNIILKTDSEIKSDLLSGKYKDYRFDTYGMPFIVTINFREKTEENGEMYLKINSIVTNDKVELKEIIPYK